MPISPLWRQLAIVVATLLASVSAGAGLGFPAVLLYQLKKDDSEIPLDLDSASWIGSIHGLAGIPAIIAPVVMQWKGRRFAFIAGCLLLIVGWTLIHFANGVAMILISESFHGFAANVLIAVSYDCLSEMITPVYRNIALQVYGIVNILGVAIVKVMSKFVYWRTQSIMLSLPAIFGLMVSCTWLESPLWLAHIKKLDKCKTNFIKLRGTDQLSIKELQEVIAAQNERLRKNKVPKNDFALKQILRQVTNRDFIVPALQILLLLTHSYWSGYIVVLIYSTELISRITQNETAAFIGGAIIDFVLIFSGIVCSILMKFYRNKRLLLIGSVGTTFCLFSLSIVFYLQEVGTLSRDSLLSLYFLVCYMISIGLGQSSVVFTMSSELMPVKHRGLGGALFVIYACSLHASTLKISPYLFAYLGVWVTFIIYTVNSISCALLIWKYVPETKGKTLQEIENYYSHGTFEVKLLCDEVEPVSA